MSPAQATPSKGSSCAMGEPLMPAKTPALMQLLECGFYCNNAHLSGEGGTGDPTELALRIAGAKAELVADGVHATGGDSIRLLGQVHGGTGRERRRAYYPRQGCAGGGRADVQQELSPEAEGSAFDAEPLAERTGRLPGTPCARWVLRSNEMPAGHRTCASEDLHGMSFAGLQGMIDPPKQSAIEAIDQCKEAGIRTVMITGDHPDTAQAVARQLGIMPHEVRYRRRAQPAG